MEADLPRRLKLLLQVLGNTPDPLWHPLELNFAPISAAEHKAQLAALERDDDKSPLHLYVHIPFCTRKCSYCMLASRQLESKRQLHRFVEGLCREVELLGARLDAPRVAALHLGGGTPSILGTEELERVLTTLRSSFEIDARTYFAAELHPRTSNREKLALLEAFDIDRVSFGVQTLTRDVLRRIGRESQRWHHVEAAVAAARESKIPAINLDLLAGLPGEDARSFARSVKACLELTPESLSVNRFMVESSSFEGCEPIDSVEDPRRADLLMVVADRLIRKSRPPLTPERPLVNPGYGAAYTWDGSLPSRGLLDQTEASVATVLGIGYGGLSHLRGQGFSTHRGSLDDTLAALQGGTLPEVAFASTKPGFDEAFFIAEAASRGALDRASFRALFHVDLEARYGEELDFLTREGLLRRRSTVWTKPENLDFQPLHLLSFMLLDEDELTSSLRRIESSQERPTSERNRSRLRQYKGIGAEMPLSYVWCRISLRAARQSQSQML